MPPLRVNFNKQYQNVQELLNEVAMYRERLRGVGNEFNIPQEVIQEDEGFQAYQHAAEIFYEARRKQVEEFVAQQEARKVQQAALDAKWADLEALLLDPYPAFNEVIQEDDNMLTINKFLIGCDPELIALQRGNLYNVSGFLQKHAPLALDHNGRVVEIQPTPSRSTFNVAKRIRAILGGAHGEVLRKKKLDLTARSCFEYEGGRKQTIGGHVHFGIPYLVDGQVSNRIKVISPALDHITKYMEKLDILPYQSSVERRRSGAQIDARYGKWGDWRGAGDDGHAEYRTMGSWMHHPVNAFIALTAAKIAATYPKVTTKMLKDPAAASQKEFNALFEHLKNKDVDCARITEKVIENKVSMQHPDNESVFKAWKEFAVLEG